MKKVKDFLKKEAVFSIAALAALVSAFFVPPSRAYIGYINFSVLLLLFSLMAVVSGLSRLNVFKRTAEELIGLTGKGGCRTAAFVLWAMSFFGSMFITNDVALMTFVPLAITFLTLINAEENIIPLVVLQTAAANLGSMATPIGNPQNLFLYDTFGISAAEFFKIMLPYTAASFALLTAATFVLIKNKKINYQSSEKTKLGSGKMLAVYVFLTVLCLLSVAKKLDHRITAAAVFAVMILFDRKTFKNIDWFLLLTFVMFFIFVGNAAALESVRKLVSQMISGREAISAVILSQVISNVPATLLLSGFAKDLHSLLIGVNVGGLGTLIASMASLISYKAYTNAFPQKKKNYFLMFTAVNVAFLAFLCIGRIIIS